MRMAVVTVLSNNKMADTAILIIIEGQLQVFQRFSGSKMVLKPLKAVLWHSIIMKKADM